MSVTKGAKLFPDLSDGEDSKGMNGQTPFRPFNLCHINAFVKWGKAENAQFFCNILIENFLSQQNINLKIQKYNCLASLLNLPKPPPIFCFSYHHSGYGCVITQRRALRPGHRIQGLILFATILIISVAALKCFFMCHLSIADYNSFRVKVKFSSFISVTTYSRALHSKWQCCSQVCGNHRIFFFTS